MALEKRDSGGSGSTTPSSDIVLTTLDQQSSIAALSLRGVEVSRAPSCSNASGKLVRRNSSNGLIRSLVASSAPASSSSHSRTTRSSTLTKHEETLCTFLAASANSPWLTDVKLICDDGSLLASRFVLASASPKFLRQALKEDADTQQQESTVLVPGVTTKELSTALELLYSGSTSLDGSRNNNSNSTSEQKRETTASDAARYRDCLRLVSSLGIPLEDLVVETKVTAPMRMAALQQTATARHPPSGAAANSGGGGSGAECTMLEDTASKRKGSVGQKLGSVSSLLSNSKEVVSSRIRIEPPKKILATVAGGIRHSSTSSVVTTTAPLSRSKTMAGLGADLALGRPTTSSSWSSTSSSSSSSYSSSPPSSSSASPTSSSAAEFSLKTPSSSFEEKGLKEESDADGSSNIMYKCDLCQKRFRLMDFLRHQDTHKDDLPYTCPSTVCGNLKFKTQSEFRSHLRLSHKASSTSTSTSTSSSSTTSSHTVKGSSTVPSPTSSLASQPRQQAPPPPQSPSNEGSSDSGNFTCPQCNQTFNSVPSMKSHLLKNHLEVILRRRAAAAQAAAAQQTAPNALFPASAVSSAASPPPSTPQPASNKTNAGTNDLIPGTTTTTSSSSSSSSSSPTELFPSTNGRKQLIPMPKSVSKGVFNCKMCNTSHHSWDAFSKHFLRSHGSMPKILLKYKCVPCNVSLPSRSDYHKHCQEKHGGGGDGLGGDGGASSGGAIAGQGDRGGKGSSSETTTTPVRLVFAAPASYLHSSKGTGSQQHKSPAATATASLPPQPAPCQSFAASATVAGTASAPPVTSFMPRQVSCTATLQLRQPVQQQSTSTFSTAVLQSPQVPFQEQQEQQQQQQQQQQQKVKHEQQQQQHPVPRRSGRGACKYCEECKVSFKTSKSYKRHFEQRHSTSGPRHACQSCPRVFRRSDNLNAHHRAVHLGVRPNRCEWCSKTYRSRTELQRHQEHQCSSREEQQQQQQQQQQLIKQEGVEPPVVAYQAINSSAPLLASPMITVVNQPPQPQFPILSPSVTADPPSSHLTPSLALPSSAPGSEGESAVSLEEEPPFPDLGRGDSMEVDSLLDDPLSMHELPGLAPFDADDILMGGGLDGYGGLMQNL